MRSAETQSITIWIDATLVLRAGTDTATGIPRVEAALCKYALKNKNVGLLYLNKKMHRYSILDDKIEKYLVYLLTETETKTNDKYIRRVINNFKFISFQLFIDRTRTIKKIANTLSGNSSLSHYAYIIFYPLVFIIFNIIKMFTNIEINSKIECPTNGSIILTSFHSKRLSYLKKALDEFNGTEAHVIYDLLTVLQPQLFKKKLTESVNGWMTRALRNNSPIIAISETVAGEVSAWNEQDIKAVRTLPIKACKLSVSFDVSSDQVEPVTLLQGRNFAMFVSSIDIRKGQDHLVRVWKSLSERIDRALLPDLVLIGRKGSGWDQLMTELNGTGLLRDKIHVLTNVADAQLRWCFQHASFSLFPSIAEGWGLGISEALAYQVPVLHSDIPVFHEVSQGLMPSAAPRDIDAWANIIEGFIKHPEQLAALRNTIKQEYVHGHPDDFARCVFAYLHTLTLRT